MRNGWRRVGSIGMCLAALSLPAEAAPGPSCFARALPGEFRGERLNDLKFLLGFVFDAASAHLALPVGSIIDHTSGLRQVPGFVGPTDLRRLAGRYRVMQAFDQGHGYFGLLLGSLDESDDVTALILANRLFRLPTVTHDPVGVLTDVLTNAAMWAGRWTRSVIDANQSAAAAAVAAMKLDVPLFLVGQSQAGGVAQLQAAFIATTYPERPILTGFIAFNPASVARSLRRLGQVSEAIGGISFLKDLDPGFGPHGLLPNHAGLAVYVHPDNTGGGTPGAQSFVTALMNARQHTLESFNEVSLPHALDATLASQADDCPAP
jgi:hypothetical protein